LSYAVLRSWDLASVTAAGADLHEHYLPGWTAPR
jgi:hypothetical protein